MHYTEKEQMFKKALRMQILSRNKLVRQELAKGTRFVYSENYPTQVLNTSLGRFIRVNQADINENSIHNMLRLLMGIDNYVKIPSHTKQNPDGTTEEIPEFTQDISDVLSKAKDKVYNTDYMDLNTFNPANVNRAYDPETKEQHEYYYEPSDVFNYDSFGNITGTTFNLVPQLLHPQEVNPEDTEFDPAELAYPEPSEITESIEGDSTGSEVTSEMSAEVEATGEDDLGTSVRVKVPAADVRVDQELADLPQYEGISRFHSDTSVLSKKDILALEPKVKTLLRAFKGIGDEIKIVTPTKRISSKDIASDRDKCYKRKTGIKGKHIKLNLLIDMSGSMSGSPVKNAVRLVYLFNQLAKQGYVTMSVLYSSTSSHYKLDLPCSDSEILALNKAQSAEGLAKTIEHYKDHIRGINTICITDGDIVDEA